MEFNSKTTDEIVKNTEFKVKDYNKEIKQIEKKINDYRKLLFEIRKQNMLNEIERDQYNFEKEQYEKEIHELSVMMDVLQQKSNKHQDYEKLRKEIQTSVGYLTLKFR
ncbi:hypothetical protein P4H66_17835 [Paenibacillus dokdonensis]|uniref:Uncharacterized protein n=1 Tax=Paenibacillus dokdonensis TaxID=2567944 RepID=A0ABU6GPP9_9BACL|nr:hypothetical protein [Paenibacillus dokdonensis]MEC0241680.1 hypothetical protein [Paenibacillus dokdonensis]